MTRPHVFDAHFDSADQWLTELATNLDLAPDDTHLALHALRAGLHALRDRLPPHEVLDLSAQLPVLIRGFFLDGWTLRGHSREIRDREDMITRVRYELGPNARLAAVDVLRAVIHLLVQHVSRGEIDDMVATLPKSIKALWHDLVGYADAAPPRLEHRTGYSR